MKTLYEYLERPLPYAPSPSIWMDGHIAEEMLKAHLTDTHDAASYRTKRREGVCAYLYEALGLHPGKSLVDFGCGPGLYTRWFAEKGIRAMGVDVSESSIKYALAHGAGPLLHYLVGDYRMPLDIGPFDAAIMVSEDYGVLAPEDRRRVLQNIHKTLAPGGLMALDVTHQALWAGLSETSTWQRVPHGFYRPHPYVLLEARYLYPKIHVYCDAHVVIDDKVTPYFVYQTLFTPSRIEAELAGAGFAVTHILGGLDGSPYDKAGRQMGVIARKISY